MSRTLKEYIIASDDHKFIGRVHGLSIVSLSFDSYEEMARYADVKYALHVNRQTSLLTTRVESLNHVGNLLWPKRKIEIAELPTSAYEFCNIIQDSFLMRIISILDCCCLLANEVLELNIEHRNANLSRIEKRSKHHVCCKHLRALSAVQSELRTERNIRFHRGVETPLTADDATFRMAAHFHHGGRGLTGTDRYGRKINLDRMYREAIRGMRSKFVLNARQLNADLNRFYGSLYGEFNNRFRRKFRAPGSFGRVQGVVRD